MSIVLLAINPDTGWVVAVHNLEGLSQEQAEQTRGAYDKYEPHNIHRLVTDSILIEKLMPRIIAFRLVDGNIVEVPEETDRRAARKLIDARTDIANDMISTNEVRRVANLLLELVGPLPDSWSEKKKAYFNELKELFGNVHRIEDITTVGPLTPDEATAELTKANPVDAPSEGTE